MIFTESFACNHLLELADRIPVGVLYSANTVYVTKVRYPLSQTNT